MLRAVVFFGVFLGAQTAFAANVYVPVVCEIDVAGNVDCIFDHEDAYLSDDDEWTVEVPVGDTVYFQVSDFTEGSDQYVVSGKSVLAATSFTWTKSGSTATSPGAVATSDFGVEIEAEAEGKPKPPKNFSITLRVNPPGA